MIFTNTAELIVKDPNGRKYFSRFRPVEADCRELAMDKFLRIARAKAGRLTQNDIRTICCATSNEHAQMARTTGRR